MKSISLELPAETAREILPIMEKKETELRLAFETYAKQVRMVRAAILAAHDRPKAPDAALALPGLVTDPIKSSSGKRVKKGESKHAIESYLSLVGESGTTFSDVIVKLSQYLSHVVFGESVGFP